MAELWRSLVHEVAETPEPFTGDATRPGGLVSGQRMAKLRAVVFVCKGCDADFKDIPTGVCSSGGNRLRRDDD